MRFITIVAVMIAVVVIILAVIGVNRGWFTIRPRAEAGKPLLPMGENDVTELTVAIEGRPATRLLLHGDQWRLVAPLRAPANDQQVRRLIRSVLDMRISRLYSPSDPKRPKVENTGLASPRAVVTLTDRRGRGHTVQIGGRPILAPETYARLEGTSDILLAKPDPTAQLACPLADLRVPALLELDTARVRGLVVIGRSDYRLARRDGTWRLSAEAAPEALADSERVDRLIATLDSLQITGVNPRPATDLKAFGLDPPAVTFTFDLSAPPGPRAQEAGDTLTVSMGAQEGVVYAMLADDPWLLTIDPSDFEDLVPTAKSLRDRRILPIAAGRIVRIDTHLGPVTMTVQRTDGRWVRADGAPADGEAIEAMLAALTDPRVTDFVDDYASLVPFGLDKPLMRYTCTTRAGDTRTILVGNADSRQRVYVKHDDAPTVLMAHVPELTASPTGEP